MAQRQAVEAMHAKWLKCEVAIAVSRKTGLKLGRTDADICRALSNSTGIPLVKEAAGSERRQTLLRGRAQTQQAAVAANDKVGVSQRLLCGGMRESTFLPHRCYIVVGKPGKCVTHAVKKVLSSFLTLVLCQLAYMLEGWKTSSQSVTTDGFAASETTQAAYAAGGSAATRQPEPTPPQESQTPLQDLRTNAVAWHPHGRP